jgi:flagellar FliL protein
MSEKIEDKPGDKPVKKKGKLGKLLMVGGALLVLVGGGVGAGLYAANAGLVGGGDHAEAADGRPKLVPKSEQKRGGEGTEKSGGGDAPAESHGGRPTPQGEGGERHASNYHAMEKEFTSNLQNSVHFIQVGVAVSTPYDDTVIEHLKTNEIAVRSAILMTLGDTSEEQVFTSEGKRQLQRRLVVAINETLKQKEGFGGVGNVYFTNFVVQ